MAKVPGNHSLKCLAMRLLSSSTEIAKSELTQEISSKTCQVEVKSRISKTRRCYNSTVRRQGALDYEIFSTHGAAMSTFIDDIIISGHY